MPSDLTLIEQPKEADDMLTLDVSEDTVAVAQMREDISRAVQRYIGNTVYWHRKFGFTPDEVRRRAYRIVCSELTRIAERHRKRC
jgi:hypothetical protein